MSMTDPIADMFTRIRNAQAMGKRTVKMPASRVKQAIAGLLKDEGYIADAQTTGSEAKPTLEIALKLLSLPRESSRDSWTALESDTSATFSSLTSG